MTHPACPATKLGIFTLLGALTLACGDGNDPAEPGESSGGSTASGGSGGTSSGGTGGSGAGPTGGGSGVPTPMGTLFMDDFEGGITAWNVTQGSCSIQADDTNVLNCTNGGNEARAFAGDVWGDYTVRARVKINMMDPDRRIYLAARFTDSNNWYGAAIYNSAPIEVQLRKKVAGASADIARGPYPFETDTFYTLALEVKGSTLSVFVNDVLQLTAEDTEFASGRIALLVDRSDISWDDVLVTNP